MIVLMGGITTLLSMLFVMYILWNNSYFWRENNPKYEYKNFLIKETIYSYDGESNIKDINYYIAFRYDKKGKVFKIDGNDDFYTLPLAKNIRWKYID